MTQFDVAKSYALQSLDFIENLRHVLEEFHRLVDGHVEYIGDTLALVAYLQGFTIVSFAVAYLAWHVDIRQEVHLDGLVAVALAFLASAALHVEGESTRLVTTNLSFRQTHEEGTDVGEYACVCGWVAARRATNWTLVYVHHLIYIVDALDAVVWHRFLQ